MKGFFKENFPVKQREKDYQKSHIKTIENFF
jgi:hypothetical protein